MTYSSTEHEMSLVRFMDDPSQVRRYSYFMEKNRRSDALRLFWNDLKLDPRYHTEFEPAHEDAVINIVGKESALAMGHIMSNYVEFDGKQLLANEIFKTCLDASFVSFIPGKLGFFAYEGGNDVYLLTRDIRI